MSELPVIGIVQRTRKSPFFEGTVRFGAKGFTVYNHMLMPIYYESPEADYWNLINNVSMWDVACERQVEITGPDAFRLTQLLTPRNLSECSVGQCKYAPLVDENGGMINDPVLLRLGGNHFWLSLADSDVLLWAKGVALGYGFDVHLCEPDVSPLAIQGPNAEKVTADLLGDWVKDLRFFRFKETHLDQIPLVVARSGWSKQGGFELYLRDGRYGEELWDRVAAAGKAHGIAPGTPSTIERIESGLLSYGNDMTLENNPFEIGLGKYCDLDQEADFIGKDALKRIAAEGVTQKLVGIEILGEPLRSNTQHWPIYKAGQRIGQVTSCVYSPRLKKNIGLAMLKLPYTEIGTPFEIDTPQGSLSGLVAETPKI